jgi:hypothetical protein
MENSFIEKKYDDFLEDLKKDSLSSLYGEDFDINNYKHVAMAMVSIVANKLNIKHCDEMIDLLN